MANSEELQTFAARLSTFEAPKQVNKRRVSNNRKKQPTTVTWPHTTPDPEQLAKAGFYYKPSSSSPDSVTCFLCEKALDGWDTDDDPALEHLNHVPDCGWAINCCIEQRSQDMDRAEEDPLSVKMVESRLATFREWWPHETKKGWKCKTQKMVDAGWCYSPLPEADDCVTCFYCGISLDGWEPKDDPWQEHRKRAPDCHFFTLVEESAQLKKATKTKKGKNTRNSKTIRQSARSTAAADEDAPLAPEPTTEEGDSIMSTASTASKAARPRRKNTKSKAPPRKGKKTTRTTSDSLDESTVTHQTEEELNDELTHQIENELNAELNAELEQPAEDSEESKKPPKPNKGSKRGKPKRPNNDSIADEPAVQPEQPKPRSLRGTRKGNTKPPTNEVQLPSESHSSSDAKEDVEAHAEKPKRGKKRMSDGSEKLDSSVVVVINPPQQVEETSAPIMGKRTSASEEAEMSHQTEGRTENDQPEAKSSPPKPRNTKSRKQQKAIATEPTPDREQGSRASTRLASLESLREVSPQLTKQDTTTQDDRKPQKNTQDEPRQEATPPPPGPTDAPNPSRTPQSSDAENQPPSTRPASSKRPSNLPPQSHQTPRTSPSKRNIVTIDAASNGGWHAIDLDGVFLPSPSYAHLADKDAFNIDTIIQNLTTPEKRLTVEEWIKKNAGDAEERLRMECERMIGRFEEEGNRALTAMEGVECA